MWKPHCLELMEVSSQYRCTVCQWRWKNKKNLITDYCPGLPRYGGENDWPPHLLTFTQIDKRKLRIDRSQPDGCYYDSYHREWHNLYDVRKAVPKLDEKKIAANGKRAQTMRERYGCRLCTAYYRKKDLQWFRDGVCNDCQGKASSWNGLIALASGLMQKEGRIIDLATEPCARPSATFGSVPLPLLNVNHWWNNDLYRLAGYQIVDLVDGDIIHNITINERSDWYMLQHSISPHPDSLFPTFPVIFASSFAFSIAEAALKRELHRYVPTHMDIIYLLPTYGSQLYCPNEKKWQRFLCGEGKTEREMLEECCHILGLGVSEADTNALLIRRLILHLAAEAPIIIN